MRDEPAAPTLLAVAHGTRDLAGIATYRALLDLVRAQRPGLTAHLSFLDLALPTAGSGAHAARADRWCWSRCC